MTRSSSPNRQRSLRARTCSPRAFSQRSACRSASRPRRVVPIDGFRAGFNDRRQLVGERSRELCSGSGARLLPGGDPLWPARDKAGESQLPGHFPAWVQAQVAGATVKAAVGQLFQLLQSGIEPEAVHSEGVEPQVALLARKGGEDGFSQRILLGQQTGNVAELKRY